MNLKNENKNCFCKLNGLNFKFQIILPLKIQNLFLLFWKRWCVFQNVGV